MVGEVEYIVDGRVSGDIVDNAELRHAYHTKNTGVYTKISEI